MSKKIQKRNLIFYQHRQNEVPFIQWLESLDTLTQLRIKYRLVRVEAGNLGDCVPLGEGVFELRFFFGSGYRVYLGEIKRDIILLLGGDKGSQKRDIRKVKEYWREYKESLK